MIQREYHKIETLFERDITGSKKLLPGQYILRTEWTSSCST